MTENNDWKEIEGAWRSHEVDPHLAEAALEHRPRTRALLLLQAIAEGVSFLIAVGVWVAFISQSHAPVFGVLMLVMLFVYEASALWVRRRGPVSDTVSVLDRLDLAIEQENRTVRSIQLSHAAAMLALAALICAVLFLRPFSLSMAVGTGCFAAYVFGMHVSSLVQGRRVRRRLERFEKIRGALRA